MFRLIKPGTCPALMTDCYCRRDPTTCFAVAMWTDVFVAVAVAAPFLEPFWGLFGTFLGTYFGAFWGTHFWHFGGPIWGTL